MNSLDEQIEIKRAEVAELSAEFESALAELHFLFRKKAERLCPLEIGTVIEYRPGKFGLVDRVGFSVERGEELKPNTPVNWTVSGRKLNQDHHLGKLDYHPVGPATHTVNKTVFRKKKVGFDPEVTVIDEARPPDKPLLFDLVKRKRVL